MTPNNLLVIIPCYNEADRIDFKAYQEGIKNTHLDILFVDDGSQDSTVEKLNVLKSNVSNHIRVLALEKNVGKAGAVYQGVQYAINNTTHNYIAYIDADLAVSLEEIFRLKNIAIEENKIFIFGARWKSIGRSIERKISRHYIGRGLATIISSMLGIGVYDTQCGAKVFERNFAEKIFKDQFNVGWLFDVEIFFRLKKIYPNENISEYCKEIPLKEWKDVEGSKVKFTHFFNIVKDLFVLKKKYSA